MNNLENATIGILGLGYLGQNLSSFFKKLDQNINVIEIKRNNLNDILNIQFDYFINCAGNSGDFRNFILETIESNISLNIFLLKNLKVKYTYIYLSTSRAYGFTEDEKIIFTEDYIYSKPNTNLDYIYDGSKLLVESMLLNYSSKINFKIAILRLTNVYGKFQNLDDKTLIKKIIRCYLKNESLNIPQNKLSKKNYIHIDDFTSAIKEIFLNLESTNFFNLGSNENLSLEYICKTLCLDTTFNDEKKQIANISINKFKNYFPNWKPTNNFIKYVENLKKV